MWLYRRRLIFFLTGVCLLTFSCSIHSEQERSRDNISVVLDNDPRNADAYNLRGISYARSNNPDEAIEDFTTALNLKKDFYQAYYNRGHVYLKMGLVDAALENFNQAIKIKPNYAQAYLSRAKLNYNKGQYNVALKDANLAIKNSPNLAEAYFYKGLIYERRKQFSKAYYEYTSAIALEYVTEEVLYKRIAVGIELKYYMEVTEDIERLLAMNALNYRAFSLLGFVNEKMGKHDVAKKFYKRALGIKPSHEFSRTRIKSLESAAL